MNWQLDVTRSLRYLTLITSARPMPRSLHTQTPAGRAVLASYNTGGRAVKQPLRSSRVTASIRRWKVPIGCVGGIGSACTTEISLAVWMGCRQTRRHASWTWHTDTIDGVVTELRRDIGARAITKAGRMKDDTPKASIDFTSDTSRTQDDGQQVRSLIVSLQDYYDHNHSQRISCPTGLIPSIQHSSPKVTI
jgi:hypothetical protein